MSGIVLSASVRQNLLSLQSTADLLATTQSRLATGKKVNSALDNPTNFFTACFARQPRQRHQQPARRHRQRRAGAAGRQHRHLLAAEAGRQRQVGRQPGAADPGRLRQVAVQPARSRAPPPTTCSAPRLRSPVRSTAGAFNHASQTYLGCGFGRHRGRQRSPPAPSPVRSTPAPARLRGGRHLLTGLSTVPTLAIPSPPVRPPSPSTRRWHLAGHHDRAHDAVNCVLIKLGPAGGVTATLIGGALQLAGTTGAGLINIGSAAGDFGLTAGPYAGTNGATSRGCRSPPATRPPSPPHRLHRAG